MQRKSNTTLCIRRATILVAAAVTLISAAVPASAAPIITILEGADETSFTVTSVDNRGRPAPIHVPAGTYFTGLHYDAAGHQIGNAQPPAEADRIVFAVVPGQPDPTLTQVTQFQSDTFVDLSPAEHESLLIRGQHITVVSNAEGCGALGLPLCHPPDPVQAPEPGSFGILAAALAGLGFMRWRKANVIARISA